MITFATLYFLTRTDRGMKLLLVLWLIGQKWLGRSRLYSLETRLFYLMPQPIRVKHHEFILDKWKNLMG